MIMSKTEQLDNLFDEWRRNRQMNSNNGMKGRRTRVAI